MGAHLSQTFRLVLVRLLAAMLAMHAGTAEAGEAVEAPCINWTPRTLPAVEQHLMAFDSHRDRLVVIGLMNICGQTWEWDGSQWSLMSSRFDDLLNVRAMAYDEVRRRVVLFAGTTATSEATFEWDGSAWTARAGVCCNSGSLDYAAMTFDESRGRVVLLTRCGSQLKLFSWNGIAWEPISEGLGTLHYYGFPISLAYDRQRAVLVAVVRWGNVNGTYEFTNQGWIQRSVGVPPERTVESIAFDPSRQRVVLHAGASNGTVFSDTWDWDGSSWTERQTTGAIPRFGHKLVTDTIRNRVLCLGSSGGDRDPRLMALDGGAWLPLTTDAPRAGDHVATYFPPLGKIVLFEGETGLLWLWGQDGWTNSAASGPTPRRWYGMAYDAARQRLVLHGGLEYPSSLPLADTWEFDGHSWQQMDTLGLGTRSRHALAFDPTIGKVVLFGGIVGSPSESIYSGDLWAWDGSAWALIRDDPGLARCGHSMTYDAEFQRLIVAGGFSPPSNFSPSTMYRSTGGWSFMSGPTDHAARIAFDSVRRRVVMTGIGPGSSYGDLWELEGNAWTRRLTAQVPCPSLTCIEYDPLRERLVRFTDSLWEIGSRGVSIQSQPTGRPLPAGASLDLQVVADGSPEVAYQWRRNGQALPGANQPIIRLESVSLCDSGIYDCLVSNCCSSTTSQPAAVSVAPDFTADARVDTADLVLFLGSFGLAVEPFGSGDLNGDGLVDTADLVRLLGGFGSTCSRSR